MTGTIYLEQYPKGSAHTCFVNPGNAAEAVLHRGVSNMMWIIGAFGGLFMLFGLGGMIGSKK
ncbi:MAG TPA: hypothetical protein VLJ10_01215 [Candidatus Bathyarchaeia archaeon]|nr:hypothetical protein [Candidatus Bathyarchaeia archaeon]